MKDMGMMQLTPSLLDASDERVNLALIVGPMSDLISDEIEREVEWFEEYFYDQTGVTVDEYCREHDTDLWNEVSYDFMAMFHKLWSVVPDILETELPDIFGEHGPVKVSSYDEGASRPTNREVAMFTWSINGQKLWDLARDELDMTEIHDGHSLSGFIRTCEDSYWAQCETVEALVPDEFWYSALDEIGTACLFDGMISFGKLDELI